jgi:hypothetical protein
MPLGDFIVVSVFKVIHLQKISATPWLLISYINIYIIIPI